jgi:hypothetical protein
MLAILQFMINVSGANDILPLANNQKMKLIISRQNPQNSPMGNFKSIMRRCKYDSWKEKGRENRMSRHEWEWTKNKLVKKN